MLKIIVKRENCIECMANICRSLVNLVYSFKKLFLWWKFFQVFLFSSKAGKHRSFLDNRQAIFNVLTQLLEEKYCKNFDGGNSSRKFFLCKWFMELQMENELETHSTVKRWNMRKWYSSKVFTFLTRFLIHNENSKCFSRRFSFQARSFQI